VECQLKGYMARHNKTFNLWEVYQVAEAGLGDITAERRQDGIHHIIQEEQTYNIVD
jgi:hypothetical protein